MGYCYLLHFERPISDRHTCQHYLGYTSKKLRERMELHRAGNGARLTQVARERGISFMCVRVWRDGTRGMERQLKNRKNGFALCPICQGKPIRCRTR
jgi:predicted GIY-YIG superfamily endonuclease